MIPLVEMPGQTGDTSAAFTPGAKKLFLGCVTRLWRVTQLRESLFVAEQSERTLF